MKIEITHMVRFSTTSFMNIIQVLCYLIFSQIRAIANNFNS